MPKHFRHVGIVVSDLDAAVEAFRVFGFMETKRFDKVDSEQVRRIIGVPDGILRISILRDSENITIELLEYLIPRTEQIRPKVNMAGVSHLALRVEDIAGIYAKRDALGFSFLSAPVTNADKTAVSAYVLVLDEILVEIVQVITPAADYS